MTDLARTRTRTDAIVYRLTEEIVGKLLAPGTALDELSLARRLGVSRTPVREALRQLAAGGLVEMRPHRAPLVAAIDLKRLQDMFDVMAELEACCAARAAIAMTPAERRRLEEQHRSMATHVREVDVEQYRAGNLALHDRIYDGADNGFLKELVLATRHRLAPYRGAQLESPARMARSHAEHGRIVEAILRAESARAAELMRQHLTLTREALERLLQRETLPTDGE